MIVYAHAFNHGMQIENCCSGIITLWSFHWIPSNKGLLVSHFKLQWNLLAHSRENAHHLFSAARIPYSLESFANSQNKCLQKCLALIQLLYALSHLLWLSAEKQWGGHFGFPLDVAPIYYAVLGKNLNCINPLCPHTCSVHELMTINSLPRHCTTQLINSSLLASQKSNIISTSCLNITQLLITFRSERFLKTIPCVYVRHTLHSWSCILLISCLLQSLHYYVHLCSVMGAKSCKIVLSMLHSNLLIMYLCIRYVLHVLACKPIEMG